MLRNIDGLNVWSEAWAGLVGAVLWQSTLLVAAIALLALGLRRSSPTVRYWLWQIVAIKLLVMPFWTLAVPMPFLSGRVQPSSHAPALAADVGPAVAGAETLPGLPEEGEPSGSSAAQPEWAPPWLGAITWRSWLFVGWAAVVAFQVIRLLRQRSQLGYLLRHSTPTDEELGTLIGELAHRLGLKRAPEAVVADGDCSLFVCGVRRPVVVVPAGLVASLHPGQLGQALLHELAHVKRLDLLWGWPMEIARIVYFFHPLVHWAGHQLRLERELACDQLAMSLSVGGAGDYAATLVEVVKHASCPTAIRTQAAISAGLDGGASPSVRKSAEEA